MANKPKAIGTKFENEILDLVQPIWPDADRAKAGSVSCDLINTGGVVIECKHRKTWAFPEWVRRIRRRQPNNQWAIFAGDGDRRLTTSCGTVAVFDAEFAVELLDVWNDLQLGVLIPDLDNLFNSDIRETGGEA